MLDLPVPIYTLSQVSTLVGDCLRTPGTVGMGLDILAAMRRLWPLLVLVCFASGHIR